MDQPAEDPVARFAQLAGATQQVDPELSTPVLQQVIEGADGKDDVTALSEHLAKHSRMTVEEAKPVVAAAVDSKTDPREKAQAVSKAAAGSTGVSADIELSDPVMLTPWARVAYAGMLCVALLLCIIAIWAQSGTSGVAGSAMAGLAVIGVLALVGILVLVMGYKNVQIKGSPPGGSG